MAITRPPFTGIHEVYPNSGGNVPHEGGGALPVFGEDPFQRIVDINFGDDQGIGGVFVSGDICCYLRAVSVPTLTMDQQWQGLGALAFTSGGGNEGCTYAKVNGRPTFLMVGGGWLEDGGSGYNGVIMISHDGFNWATTFNASTNPEALGDWVYDVMWDAGRQLFYANSAYSRNRYSSWTSPDGYTWTYAPGDDFWSHTNQAGIPGFGDGIIGHDPVSGLIINPFTVPSDLIYARCTAYAGGIWMAAGEDNFTARTATVCSLDAGETWGYVTIGAIGASENWRIECMSGAPLEDFS